MKLNIAGRDVALGDALKTRIQSGVEDAVEKFFDREGAGHVTVAKQGHLFQVDISIHLPSGINLQASGQANDAHDAFNQTLEKLEKRIRRHHRRLKDHHRNAKNTAPPLMAVDTIFANQADETVTEVETPPAPLTIAETEAELPILSVADAIFRLELIDNPALMFVNSANERTNMVYRRPDGHIGWLDPKA